MRESAQIRLSQRVNRLRWQAPVLAFLLVLADQLLEHTWLGFLPAWGHFVSQMFFYGVIGSTLVWWGLTSLRRQVDETEAAQRALQQAHAALKESNHRLELLIRVNHRLAETEDEEALVDVILDLPLEVVPALGCSLIRLDEAGRPRLAAHRGALDPAVFEAWAAHLAANGEGEGCGTCAAGRVTPSVSCPLDAAGPGGGAVGRVHCLVLARGGREYGQLNVFLPDAGLPAARERTLLAAMANEISFALESQYLRSRELSTLHRLQDARRLSSLHSTLTEVLDHTVAALEVDGGALFLADPDTAALGLVAEAGRPLGSTLAFVQGLAGGARPGSTPLVIRDLAPGSVADGNLRSLLVAPLASEDRPLGSLVLWAACPDAFVRRHVQLMATMAGQVSLLVENHRLYLQAEHQVALAERTRLAREIHDGLAQTLGYLKLRSTQLVEWLAAGETGRLGEGLDEVQALLVEAYTDVREAIDGLRVKPGNGRLRDWLEQTLLEFQVLSGIEIEATALPELSLPPEVQTQLLRIVQEALSNVRKHSNASRARVECRADADWLVLCVADNGRGFDAADVPPISQHGLRSMRERAELLDADFRIISRPGAGAQVIVSLPLKKRRPEYSYV